MSIEEGRKEGRMEGSEQGFMETRQLLAKGTALACRSICICLCDPKMPFAYNQTEPVHKALEEMVVEFDVPEDMITNKTFDYV